MHLLRKSLPTQIFLHFATFTVTIQPFEAKKRFHAETQRRGGNQKTLLSLRLCVILSCFSLPGGDRTHSFWLSSYHPQLAWEDRQRKLQQHFLENTNLVGRFPDLRRDREVLELVGVALIGLMQPDGSYR